MGQKSNVKSGDTGYPSMTGKPSGKGRTNNTAPAVKAPAPKSNSTPKGKK